MAAAEEAGGLAPASACCMAMLIVARTRDACGGSTRWTAISSSVSSTQGLTVRSLGARSAPAGGVPSARAAITDTTRSASFIRPPSSKLRCRDELSSRHLSGTTVRLRKHHEKVVASDVLVEVDPAGVHLDPLAGSRRRLPARVVDLTVHFVQPVPLFARRGYGVDGEDRPPAAEVRRKQ